MEYSRDTAFLNLLPDSRFPEAGHASAFIKGPGTEGASIMSGSLHPTEVHRRRHRKEKRHKLRAQLAHAPVAARAALEAKLQKTYALVSATPPSK